MRRILARAEIEGRADDNAETVANRLRVFDEATQPLVEYYRDRGLLHVIDANQHEDAVTEDILAALEQSTDPASRSVRLRLRTRLRRGLRPTSSTRSRRGRAARA